MMSEQTTIEVGSEVIYRGYETDMQTVRTTVEKIDYLNGRAMATIRVGARAVLKYVTELELVAPDAPALDSQAELIALRAERDALIAALREARDSLLDIRDLSQPYIENDNFTFSRIFNHAEYGLRHSEAAANKHGMEKGDKP